VTKWVGILQYSHPFSLIKDYIKEGRNTKKCACPSEKTQSTEFDVKPK
jgi:hypothetical protein